MFGVLLVGTVIFVSYGYLSGSEERDVKPQRPGVDEDVTETIVATVTSKPIQRSSNPAHIQIFVEGVQIAEEFMSLSPYNSTFKIPKGAAVRLTAEQSREGQLDCILQANGQIKTTGYVNKPGIVICTHNNARRG